MLSINMSDVINVLLSIASYMIGFGIVLLLAVIIIIAVRKKPKRVKRLIRGEACIAVVLALLIAVNLICTGPMRTMLELVSARSDLGEESTARATELVSEIVEEGVVLAKNENAILPVASGSRLNVFGWSSTSPCYGGTGSGALNTAYPTTDLLTGLKDAGIETNEELSQFYVDYQATRPEVGMWAQDWTLPEPNVSLYSQELMDNAKAFSDTAMIVITRVGGEGADLPDNMPAVVDGSWLGQDGVNKSDETYYAGVYDDTMNQGNDWDEGDHFLQLDNREEEMIDLVCSNFDKVILVYNGANAFELGWVSEYPQIQGVLLCPGTGQTGFEGFGRVVNGEVNPSGHTVDLYPASMKDAPWWNNHGSYVYDNMKDYGLTAMSFGGSETTSNPSFVNYSEGIYVGYKFYETAAKEGLIDYDKAVVYPFGYGLSYTDFTQTMSDISYDGTNASFSVTVTNNGTVAGKDVVEIYLEAPYTNGGIEKASASLLEFAKTGDIAPGASETVEFSIPVERMASYDYQGKGCYVLEAGTYRLSANADSHTEFDSKSFDVGAAVVYDQNNKRESDQTAAVNQFDYAAGDVTYLSRANHFANYKQATAAPVSYDMSDEAKATFYNITNYLTDEATAADEDPNAEPITTGASTSLKLMDLRGLDYDDPKWDELLNALTIEEMNSLTSLGGYQTAAIASIGKIRTNDCDGPASINNNFTGVGSVGFPAAVMIANTWSDDIAYRFGGSIGEMADEMDTAGWYGPAMNIHRTAFAGRNFEYYSEDGILSGSMAANAIKGAQEHGVYAYMKHFALNDQEANRCSMLCTWTNEQAMREIYLKPFEISVKEGDSLAVMSSFNYIGNRWAGGTKQLCETVLRDEWGFRGFVETDYFGVYNYMSADQAIRNGTDLMLVNYPTATNDMQFTKTNGAQQRLRQSVHRILYVVVNSRSYTEENYAKATATPAWRKALTCANVVVGVLLIAWEALLIRKYNQRKRDGE